jgi:hypothetical protein
VTPGEIGSVPPGIPPREEAPRHLKGREVQSQQAVRTWRLPISSSGIRWSPKLATASGEVNGLPSGADADERKQVTAQPHQIPGLGQID